MMENNLNYLKTNMEPLKQIRPIRPIRIITPTTSKNAPLYRNGNNTITLNPNRNVETNKTISSPIETNSYKLPPKINSFNDVNNQYNIDNQSSYMNQNENFNEVYSNYNQYGNENYIDQYDQNYNYNNSFDELNVDQSLYDSQNQNYNQYYNNDYENDQMLQKIKYSFRKLIGLLFPTIITIGLLVGSMVCFFLSTLTNLQSNILIGLIVGFLLLSLSQNIASVVIIMNTHWFDYKMNINKYIYGAFLIFIPIIPLFIFCLYIIYKKKKIGYEY